MKKTILNLMFSIGIVSLVFLGLGCKKQVTNTQVVSGTNQPVIDNGQTSTGSGDTETEITALEPRVLAYLEMTQGAKILVIRGTEQTDGLPDMALFAGDQIEVVSGEASLLYPEIGMSVLETGTKVTLIPDGDPSDDGLGLQILMEAGKIWTRLERLLGTEEEFSVEANSVVATVRGTAFGMQFVNGDLDITVADHQVRVGTRAMLNSGKAVTQSILLAAGNGIKINPQEISKMTDQRALLLKKMRILSEAEKNQPGYIFGSKKLDPARLKKPVKPFVWSALLTLRPEIQSRLTPEMLRRWQAYVEWYRSHQAELLKAEQLRLADSAMQVRFEPPLRDITLLEMTAPTSDPSIKGPLYQK